MICADCKHNPLDTGYKDMDCKCPCHTAGKRHFHYSIGPIYNLDSNGIVDTVFVGTSLGRREDVFISTSAILDSATGQAAELLFISEPEASVNTMPPPDMLEIYNKKHGGNLSADKSDGAFAVPNGNPVYRFSIPIVPGHRYQRRIIEYRTFTDYLLRDLTTGQTESFVSRYSADNQWSLASKLLRPSGP